ncbi:MAG TPA: aldehyde dehydrogenase family protein, partial [Myxococcaceae bacterium]|nr:aldehyde dehydrogenase family protein [Myxococcaceae bacterium]
MSNALFRVPTPSNEPNLAYAPGSPERSALKAALQRLASERIDIPLVIGGKEIRTGATQPLAMPHQHQHVLATYHQADAAVATRAVEAAMAVRRSWAEMPFHDRAAIFLKAADILATRMRQVVNGATMLGQSKTVFQAEIDAACELIDFLRFNVYFAERILSEQPLSSAQTWNRMDYRPLDGVVFAVSPFNFTAIGGNLSGSPALMGNTVLWKPAATAILSGYYVFKLLEEAGLP